MATSILPNLVPNRKLRLAAEETVFALCDTQMSRHTRALLRELGKDSPQIAFALESAFISDIANATARSFTVGFDCGQRLELLIFANAHEQTGEGA